MNCSSCIYADPTMGDDGQGYLRCRRFPPGWMVLEGNPLVAWPQVDGQDWCGEHVKREEA